MTRHLILAPLLALSLAGAIATAAQEPVKQTPSPRTFDTLSAENGYDYALDRSQPLVCYLDESHAYLDSAADSALLHCFANTPRGWVEWGEPTTVKAIGPLSGATAGAEFALGEEIIDAETD